MSAPTTRKPHGAAMGQSPAKRIPETARVRGRDATCALALVNALARRKGTSGRNSYFGNVEWAEMSRAGVRVLRAITRLNIGGPAIHAILLTAALDDGQPFRSTL